MGSSDPPAASLLSPRIRGWMGFVLLILGVQCWLIIGHGDYGLRMQRWLVVAVLGVSVVPAFHQRFARFLDRFRHPTMRLRCATALVIGGMALIYLPFTAWRQNRDFGPIWQDSQSYAIQIQMLGHGRLWLPAHPLSDFFDTFQMIVKPVYASMYFPGASLFYVPAAWLGVPYWIISALLSGACVGLMYWIVTEVIDGVAGMLAALMLVAQEQFRTVSIMLLGHPAILFLALVMVASWLMWREGKSWKWALILGIASGWAAITRPLDGLIIAIPIGIDMLLELRRQPARQWVSSFGAVVAAAIPFLLLQVIFNIGVTGSLTRTPFDLHADLYYPGTSIGFHAFDPTSRPKSVLPQKQKFHDEWTIPAIQRHQPDRLLGNWMNEDLNNLAVFTLPQAWLTALLPAGIVGLISRKRVFIVLTVPIWILFYCLYTFFLPHYALIAAPGLILLALLGVQQFEFTWPSIRPAIATFLTLGIVILCLTQLNEFNRTIRDQMMDARELSYIRARLAAGDVKRPAVVLFRFTEHNSPAIEPVYNLDVAWPDDAPVIRAHDLGERNIEIFNYYAKLQPDRSFYLFDRGTGSLTYLGVAKELGHAD